jgi:ketosteroid isomerase-like protein
MTARSVADREIRDPMAGDEEQPPRAAQIVARAMSAYERGDLDAMAALIHPDAEIEMLLLSRKAARGPSGLRDSLAAAQGGIHRPTRVSIEAIADDAAVMSGRIQHADEGAIYDRKAYWLTVLRDDLLWRTRVIDSMDEAPAVYEALTGRPCVPVSPDA